MVKKIYYFITHGQLNLSFCFAMLKPAVANAYKEKAALYKEHRLSERYGK